MRLRATAWAGAAVALAALVQGPAQAAPLLPVTPASPAPATQRSSDRAVSIGRTVTAVARKSRQLATPPFS